MTLDSSQYVNSSSNGSSSNVLKDKIVTESQYLTIEEIIVKECLNASEGMNGEATYVDNRDEIISDIIKSRREIGAKHIYDLSQEVFLDLFEESSDHINSHSSFRFTSECDFQNYIREEVLTPASNKMPETLVSLLESQKHKTLANHRDIEVYATLGSPSFIQNADFGDFLGIYSSMKHTESFNKKIKRKTLKSIVEDNIQSFADYKKSIGDVFRFELVYAPPESDMKTFLKEKTKSFIEFLNQKQIYNIIETDYKGTYGDRKVDSMHNEVHVIFEMDYDKMQENGYDMKEYIPDPFEVHITTADQLVLDHYCPKFGKELYKTKMDQKESLYKSGVFSDIYEQIDTKLSLINCSQNHENTYFSVIDNSAT